MRVENPVLKRCCCCLPLRHGLLAWGYFKLLITAFFLIFILATLIAIIVNGWRMYTGEYILIVVMIFLAIDVIANIIFIFGAHKKILKLLKAYFFYSIFFLTLTSLSTILFAIVVLYAQWDYITIRFIFLLGTEISVLVGVLFMQVYFIILQRNQIVKMNNTPSFRFVNNAAEAESSLVIEDPHEDKVI